MLRGVQVEAAPITETEERRFSSLTRAIYGREELDRFGDEPVTEVLKRLPGVSLAAGRGGAPRLRGLGGAYTQVLINGEPVPRGFALDNLSADQIARIEVLRSPSAEFSTQAVAGTLNLVLDEGVRLEPMSGNVSVAIENGRVSPGLGLRIPLEGERFAGSIRLGVRARDALDETVRKTMARDSSGSPTRDDAQTERLQSERVSTFAGATLKLREPGSILRGGRLTIDPFVLDSRGSSRTDIALTPSSAGGLANTSSPFASQLANTETRFQLARFQWNLGVPLSPQHNLDVSGSLRATEGRSDTDLRTVGLDGSSQLRNFNSRSSGLGLNLKPKWTLRQDEVQRLVYGLEIDAANSRDVRRANDDGQGVGAASQRFEGVSLLTAGFVQWESDLTPQLGLAPGIRVERVAQDVKTQEVGAGNVAQVISPIFNAVLRLDPEAKDQFRLGLSRTYKAPSLAELNPTVGLSTEGRLDQTNSALQPDSQGNPDLRPELAWGLDLAFEHYLPTDGILTASVFYRQIDDVILQNTRLQTVSYSTAPRFVRRPENFGDAQTYGLELEAKLKGKDLAFIPGLVAAVPGIELRSTVSRQESRVDRIPGPNNRLADQPKSSIGLGLDLPIPQSRWKFGANFSLTPPTDLQRPNNEFQRQGIRRVSELTAQYRWSSQLSLRFSVAQLLPSDEESLRRRSDVSGSVEEASVTAAQRVFRVQLDAKF